MAESPAPYMPTAPIRSPSPQGSSPTAVTAAVVIGAIAALYFGRDIFIPFALATLLSFMLAPLAARLQRWHLPRIPAVICVVAIAFALLGGLSVLVGNQVYNLAENLPGYQDNIQTKIRSFRASTTGGGVIERAVTMFENLSREVSGPEKQPSTAAPSTDSVPPKEPMTVRVEQPAQPLMAIEQVLTWLAPVGTAGIVIVFVIFILLERDDLRDRFIRLAGRDLHRTTEALNEAAHRVSRYLLMQLVVNAAYGIPVGIGLYFIGVPNAFLWGLLATLLRFVPYLGPFIASLFPLVLAFAVDPGWSMILWTVALLLGMELISNNVIEPWLYGASTGLSSVAIIFAAMFWTTLWGPIGLVLATPLTVCLVVMGRYVPQLQFLGVLLGSEPVLTPEEQVYQRLLGGNIEEAVEIAEDYAEENSMLRLYDDVCLPALRLAESDRHQGDLGVGGRKSVAEGILTIVRELEDQSKKSEQQSPTKGTWPGTPVLCVGGRGEHDRAAAVMLAQLLDGRGVGSRILPAAAIAPDAIGELDLAGVEIVVISYLHPSPHSFARYVCRRLRRNAPHLKLVVACWTLPPESGPLERMATTLGADAVVTSMEDAVRRVEGLATGTISCAPVAASLPADEEARLQALHTSGLLQARNTGQFDRIASKLAKAFETPIALVTLVDESCQIWKGASGLPADLEAARRAPRETSICGHVVAIEKPLVVEDTARDPRFANNPFLRANNIRFYAGAPLRTPCGQVVGSLCVIDTKPRSLSGREVMLLQVIADELMASITGTEDPATVHTDTTKSLEGSSA